MIKNTIGYSYNDLTILPATISHIKSRSECNCRYEDGMLPIFASPMASVVNCENTNIFRENHITPIVPRNISFSDRLEMMYYGEWIAVSLKEFEEYFITRVENLENDNLTTFEGTCYVCVDIANGHMLSLYEKCREAKKLALSHQYKLTIMTGNIANPETYKWICNFNKLCNTNVIDYIRCGIGGGSGCITTSNVSIHYPQASLLDECYHIKKSLLSMKNDLCERKYDESLFPKIVADGGIRNYDHVIKALALGADYVMIGSLFSQCIESAGIKSNKDITQKTSLRFPVERYRDFEIDENGNWWAYYTDEFIEKSMTPWKTLSIDKKYDERNAFLKEKKFIGHIDVKFFGMASADGQKSISGKKTKTAEGITKYLSVKYTLSGWVNNMESYLKSAMSYNDCKNLTDFKGNQILIVNSIAEINAVNK